MWFLFFPPQALASGGFNGKFILLRPSKIKENIDEKYKYFS